jgi:hypothetical protein
MMETPGFRNMFEESLKTADSVQYNCVLDNTPLSNVFE